MKYSIYKIIFVLLIMVAFVSCKKVNIKEVEFKDAVAENIIDLNIKENKFIDAIRDVHIYNDSLIFFTSKNTPGLYKLEIQNSNISKIGNTGKGPGEYEKPLFLLIKKDVICYSDRGSFDIQAVDFNGKFLHKYINPNFVKGKILCEDKNNNILLAGGGYFWDFYVSSLNGNNYFKVHESVKKIGNNGVSGGTAVTDSNYIYFMNAYEMKIYVANTDTKKEEVVVLNGNHKKFDWNSYGDKELSPEKMEEIFRNEISCLPIKLDVFNYAGKKYFAVMTANAVKGEEYFKTKVILYNYKGIPIVDINVNLEEPFLFENETVWVYKYSSGGIRGFSKYKLSNEILSVLKRD